jgi:hypothetical protein
MKCPLNPRLENLRRIKAPEQPASRAPEHRLAHYAVGLKQRQTGFRKIWEAKIAGCDILIHVNVFN